MALNMRRLQRIIASERIDLVHVRSRWAAWAAVKACRKANRPLVTSLPGDGVRARPRSSFETAVAEGDTVIASSEFVAGRAETLLPRASQAAEDRSSWNGSLEASSGTREWAPRVRRPRELGRRRA